jgi:hypothetical protein
MPAGLGQTNLVAVRYSERPELWDRIVDLSAQVWPEYNLHGEVLNSYWGQLYEAFPQYQFVIHDVFPRCLAPLHVDRDADAGTYWEPNVWIVHGPLRPPSE